VYSSVHTCVHSCNQNSNQGLFLREGPSPRGAASVPLFSISFPSKTARLKEQTKAEELRTPSPQLLSFRLSLLKGSLGRAISQPFLMENLLLKTPHKFKKSCGGTAEPQTTQDAPFAHGCTDPLLKKYMIACCVLRACCTSGSAALDLVLPR
jgi:hypothetical protein